MSGQRAESFPCIICGRTLLRAFEEYEGQPDEGVMCSTSGNDGSRKFDPMNGEKLCFNICDDCLVERADRIMITREAIPITTDIVMYDKDLKPTHLIHSQVGWRRVGRPYIPWNPEENPEYVPENIDIEEIIKYFDNDQFKWNLTLEGYEHLKQELDEYDAYQEATDGE